MFTKKKKDLQKQQKHESGAALREENITAEEVLDDAADALPEEETAEEPDGATADPIEEPAEDSNEDSGEDKGEDKGEAIANNNTDNNADDNAEKPESEEDLATLVEKAYCLGAGISEETLGEAKKLLAGIAESVNSGKFAPDALQSALKLLNYDKALEEARKEGLAQGRNEKISEAFRDKRRKALEADVIPRLGGAKAIATGRGSIFDVARGSRSGPVAPPRPAPQGRGLRRRQFQIQASHF